MKIIDSKGRLFGLINLIDLLILAVLCFAVVFGVKRFMTKPDESKMMKPATLTFEIADIRQITVDTLKEGHSVYYTDRSTPIGEIAKIETKPFTQPLEIDGKWVNMPVPDKFSVLLTLNVNVKDDGNAFWLNGVQVRVGIKYSLKTKFMNFESHLIGLTINE